MYCFSILILLQSLEEKYSTSGSKICFMEIVGLAVKNEIKNIFTYLVYVTIYNIFVMTMLCVYFEGHS